MGPTDTIEMMATVTSDGVGALAIYITGFEAIGINNGNLIDPEGPYTIALNSGSFDPWFSAYGGTATFLFGTLTPVGGVAPLGEYTSGFGDVQFAFSDAYDPFIVRGSNTFTVNVVPESGTLLLLGSGLVGLGFFRRRRKVS